MAIEILYGVTIVNPSFAIRMQMDTPTAMDLVKSFLHKAWYFLSQSFLLAASFTCFMWAAGAFHGN